MDSQSPVILCPMDFTTLSRSALNAASEIAYRRNARLLILYVAPPDAEYTEVNREHGSADAIDCLLAKRLDELQPSVRGVRCEHRLAHGQPATEIIRVSEREHARLIVMATHGRSVAEAVARNARCPVLAYKERNG